LPCRTRGKYVHVARRRLARVRCPAHSARPGLGVLPNPPEACLGPMAPTVLPAVALRLRTVSCARGTRAGIQKKEAKSRIKSCANQGWQLPRAGDRQSNAPRSRERVQRRRAWPCRTVRRMDAPTEPPWMGLRRVLHGHALRLMHVSGRRCSCCCSCRCFGRAGGLQARQRRTIQA